MEIVALLIIIMFSLLAIRNHFNKKPILKFGQLILATVDGFDVFLYKRLNENNTHSFYDTKYDLVDTKKFNIKELSIVNEGQFFIPTGNKRTKPFIDPTKTNRLRQSELEDTLPSNFHLETKPSIPVAEKVVSYVDSDFNKTLEDVDKAYDAIQSGALGRTRLVSEGASSYAVSEYPVSTKIKKQAEEISRTVSDGDISDSEVDELVKYGVEKESVEYYKKHYVRKEEDTMPSMRSLDLLNEKE